MTNNYKTDTGKAPVVSAVFIPFGRTLLAIAEMMERQKIHHKLQGAADPFQEWRQLPEGKDRLANAGGRHSLNPWEPNVKDRVGDHPGDLHILHAIWGLMAAYEKHLEEVDAGLVYVPGVGWRGTGLSKDLPEDPCCEAPDAQPSPESLDVARLRRAALELYHAGRWALPGTEAGSFPESHQEELWADLRDALGLAPGTFTATMTGSCDVIDCGQDHREPLNVPAGADWREPKPLAPAPTIRQPRHPSSCICAACMDFRARQGSVVCPTCPHRLLEHDAGFCYHPGCSCPVLKTSPGPRPGECVNGNDHARNPFTGKCARCGVTMERVGG